LPTTTFGRSLRFAVGPTALVAALQLSHHVFDPGGEGLSLYGQALRFGLHVPRLQRLVGRGRRSAPCKKAANHAADDQTDHQCHSERPRRNLHDRK